MLDSSRNTFLLETFTKSSGKGSREVGIFTVTFESSPTKRRSLDVNRGSKNNMGSFSFGFNTNSLANAM